MIRPGYDWAPCEINVCCNYGGLGDQIARLTAFRYLQMYQRHVKVNAYWHDYFVEIARLLLPEDEKLTHSPMSEANKAPEVVSVDFNPRSTGVTSLSMHLVEHAFLVLSNRLPQTPEDYTYPKYKQVRDVSHLNLPKNYIVLAPCFTSKTREWKGSFINDTIRGLHEMGYTTLLMGRTENANLGTSIKIKGGIPEELDRSLATLDLIDQLSLRECLDVISNARCVLGVDNGLLHLTACTDTPSVWGFTSVESQFRIPLGVRCEVVIPEVESYGFQSKACHVRWDHRICPLSGTPYQYEYLSLMQAKKFLHKVRILLDTK